MSRSLFVRNRQRTVKAGTRRLRAATSTFLQQLLAIEQYDLGIYLVEDSEMTRLNETFLRHAGTTDVITFNYAEPGRTNRLHAEIFICVNEALRQSRRFRVAWEAELMRYIVHGVLHLCGHDDRTPAQRKTMKRRENSLLRSLAQKHRFSKPGRLK